MYVYIGIPYHFALSLSLSLHPQSFTFYYIFIALDESNEHVSDTATICHTTFSTTTTTTTNSTTTTTINQARVKLKVPKSAQQHQQEQQQQTLRRGALFSQTIVIGSDELHGRNIDNVVRQKIDAFKKSPKVVRSTALIVKRSFAPAKPKNIKYYPLANGNANRIDAKIPNGDVKSVREDYRKLVSQDTVDGTGESIWEIHQVNQHHIICIASSENDVSTACDIILQFSSNTLREVVIIFYLKFFFLKKTFGTSNFKLEEQLKI